jgi:hypothetical protein
MEMTTNRSQRNLAIARDVASGHPLEEIAERYDIGVEHLRKLIARPDVQSAVDRVRTQKDAFAEWSHRREIRQAIEAYEVIDHALSEENENYGLRVQTAQTAVNRVKERRQQEADAETIKIPARVVESINDTMQALLELKKQRAEVTVIDSPHLMTAEEATARAAPKPPEIQEVNDD